MTARLARRDRRATVTLARRLVVLALLAASPAAAAPESGPTEYELKVAFLYNFAHFVDWPATAQADTLRICVLGRDPFGKAFATVLGASARRPFVVHRGAAVDDLPRCHILFVADSEGSRWAGIIGQLAARPVLTVSDMDAFAEQGGMIGFVLRDQRVAFRINPAAAEAAGLRLSAKLLRLAELVDSPDGETR